MKTVLLLRVAAVLAALQFTAHTLMFTTYRPKHGADEIAVVGMMKSHRFDFGGWSRSYWDFYYGYGLMSAFSVFLEILIFWQLAILAASDPQRVRALTLVFVGANLVHAALCLKYFFLTPIIPDLLIAACLGAAFLAARTAAP